MIKSPLVILSDAMFSAYQSLIKSLSENVVSVSLPNVYLFVYLRPRRDSLSSGDLHRTLSTVRQDKLARVGVQRGMGKCGRKDLSGNFCKCCWHFSKWV